MVHLRVYIKKVITETLLGITVLINDRQSRPCYQIQPRTAYRDIKRGAILNNRPLQIRPCGKPAHGDIPVILLPVTVIHTGSLQPTRAFRQVFRRKAPFMKPGILYLTFRVERREKPQQMVHMIDRISIQQIQILIGPAPTHIQAGLFPRCLRPRPATAVRSSPDPRLPQQSGHRLHPLGRYVDHPRAATQYLVARPGRPE